MLWLALNISIRMSSHINISIGRMHFMLCRSQDFEFKELPDLLVQHEELCEKINGFFSGDPNKIIVNL